MKEISKQPFVLLQKKMIRREEWVQIGQIGRDFYIELKLNYNGFNNGSLICSYGYMRSKYGYAFKTISKGIKILINLGFVELKERGELEGLSGKKASKYRLTGRYEKIY